MMEYQYVKTYLCDRGYFSGKFCKGACGRQIQDIAKRKGDAIYYCKIDFNRETLKDSEVSEEIQCNYIICSVCRQDKEDEFDKNNKQEGKKVVRTKRIRRTKQRFQI